MSFLSFLFKNKNKKIDDNITELETTPKPGDVFIMPVKDDILGACRVIRNGDQTKSHQKDQMKKTETGVLVALTAWYGASPPDINEPKLKELLKKTYGQFKGETEHIWIKKKVPDEFKYIGSIAPTPEELQLKGKVDAGWFWLSSIAKEQYKSDNVEVIKILKDEKKVGVDYEPCKKIEDANVKNDEACVQKYMCLAIADHLHEMFGKIVALRTGLKEHEKFDIAKCHFVTFWRVKANSEDRAHFLIREDFRKLQMDPIEIITITTDVSKLAHYHQEALNMLSLIDEAASLETEGSIAFLRSSLEGKKLALDTARKAAMPG